MEIHKIICDHCGRDVDIEKETYFKIIVSAITGDEEELFRDHHFCSDCECHAFRGVMYTLLKPDVLNKILNDPNNSDEFKNILKFINGKRESFDDDFK